MEFYKAIQYNQGVGKFKLLSSNAGVGSIITTKAGCFVMPKSVSDWGFIKAANNQVETNDAISVADLERNAGVNVIDDPRFVMFLQQDQQLPNLRFLVDIPHLALNDWNYPKEDEHPLYKKIKGTTGHILPVDHFTIPAIHFPRWFYSRKEKLFKPIQDWMDLWRKTTKDTRLEYFAPPRDPYTKTHRKFKTNNTEFDVYEPLVQVPILLICKNGHISDIPWYQLFCAGIDGRREDMRNPLGFDLFNYPCQPCEKGDKHELQWIENRSNSESWGMLKCKKCGKTYSLEGIMNIRPLCKSETPWNGIGSWESTPCQEKNGSRGVMQMALVTSNSVYYANSFSSLYIPPQYIGQDALPSKMQRVLTLLETKWYPKKAEKNPGLTKEAYVEDLDIIDKADESDIELTQEEADRIIAKFLYVEDNEGDTYERYRYQEYKVFSENSSSQPDISGLEFKDIELPNELVPYFKKIQQVNTLAITQTQLGFNRVTLPAVHRGNDAVVRDPGQKIYKDAAQRVRTLPAIQSFGEGIFFEFNPEAINGWLDEHKEIFTSRYNQPAGDIGTALKEEMDQYGAPKFYLLHTFAHIILKELEFSCGYPTASLKERLYYSDRMCGVLIYTADGSEGSMGGLVWQGQPRLISKIIKSALAKARECSSDPLCWEQDEQLNLAACFSCCLVSETSCEKMNLGLDRRALVDDDEFNYKGFGFFKSL